MQQGKLFNLDTLIEKKINFENISAIFIKIDQYVHEVLLEINSNKFLIQFKVVRNKIEEFHIISIKGFVELSLNIIKIVKKIVTTLYFNY